MIDADEQEELAEIGFVAYNEDAGGKTFDGRDIPPWVEVGEKVQANWIAAALAIEAEVKKRYGING